MVFIASENYHKIYSGNKMSWAFMFCFFVWSFIFIAPFFLAWTTPNFWPTSQFYYEQPAVKLDSKIILIAKTENQSYFYSNIDEINRKIQNNGLFPIIKFSNIDDNNDELTERIKFNVFFNINSSSFMNVDIILFFDYGLRSLVRYQMQSMVKISYLSSYGNFRAFSSGELKFKQKSTLESSFFTQNRYNYTEYNDIDVFTLPSFLQKYYYRNETLEFDYTTYQSPGFNNLNYTEISVDMQIPIYQQIEYVPTIIDSWKTAWVQYVSLFVPLYIFWIALMKFAYNARIFGTSISSNLDKIKMD